MRRSGLPLVTALVAAASLAVLACSGGEPSSATGTGGSSGGGSGGSGVGSGGSVVEDAGAGPDVDNASLTWKAATLTDFESYPAPDSVECVQYNGCAYRGMFAAFPRAKTEQWVMEHNIASVHEKDFTKYVGRTLRVRKEGHTIDAVVYDECIDADCMGCCTRNAMPSGFLIDLEKYTFQRLGVTDGQAEWACVGPNCPP